MELRNFINNSVKTTVHIYFGWALIGSFVKYETLKEYLTFDEVKKEAGEALEFKKVEKNRYKTVKKVTQRDTQRGAVFNSNDFITFSDLKDSYTKSKINRINEKI